MATQRKTTRKQPASKNTSSPSFFSAWRKDFKGRWNRNPSAYTLGTTVLLVIIFLAVLFIFNKGIFLAGTINGRFVATPTFYAKLAKNSGDEVWESLVRESLIKQEAAKKNLTSSDKDVEERIKKLEDQFGGKEAFEAAVQQNGTSIEEIKGQIELQIVVEKLLADKIAVTDKEVADYKKQNKDLAKGSTDAQIKDTLKSQKLNEKFASWFDEVKKNAKISTYF
ncbi:MAG: SurA N-terminal domain-containing protein [Candidatus Woykebacteria bacterium]